ncbi:6-phosphogluconolactonase, cycloisomerase 2 family [Streptomyces sp. yr375]|uniref:lactonase family protein n=1 Tax=Streptomyces sp. yr375 TaxID=1761906 RepID=UPI0008AD1C23|nr:lactonase family protein [Streptomyces sp. yr375]SEP71900.1 6-phosphogluconolactonase, cycloisomerase 2 family [Streptomyces sp. yr375]
MGSGTEAAGGAGWSRRRFVGVLGALGGAAAAPTLAGCAGDGGSPGTSKTPAKTSRTPESPQAAPEFSAGSAPESGPDASPGPSDRSLPRPLYLGTYTSAEGGGKGIGVASYDPGSGRITGRGTITGVPDPSYLAVHPDGRTLYAADEREAGAVTAVRLSDRKVLGSRATGGAHTCHLSVHPGGRWLLSADFGSGTVAVHPIDASGALGERTDSVTHTRPAPRQGQQGPHAHQFVTAPDGGHVLAVDFGTDTVYSYRLDEQAGTLTEVAQAHTRAGAGPRHLTFHPGGRYAYLANEADDTVTVCAYEPSSGQLTIGRPQSTGAKAGTNYPAQVAVTPDGAYAFLANRGDNSLARYAVEAAGARLRLLGTVPVAGDFPRQIALAPDGGLLFAANQRSGTVSVFRVAAASGELRLVGEPFASPVTVCALPL